LTVTDRRTKYRLVISGWTLNNRNNKLIIVIVDKNIIHLMKLAIN